MPTDLATADAELFATLHQALAELSRYDANAERRGNQRKPFRCVQLLAAYDGVSLPHQTDYAPVTFHDLSPGGFSYVADLAPQTRRLIAALGRTPFKFFVADMVNQRRITHDGQRKWLIGCRFVKRID